MAGENYNNGEIKEIYTDILNVCNKYSNNENLSGYCFDTIKNMKESAENHLEIVRWSEEFGINLSHELKLVGRKYVNLDDFQSLIYFNDAKKEKENGQGYYISWEDNNRQPKNEWLYKVNFATGSYIFGDHYPEKVFNQFFEELKSYKPKFIDSSNKALYFSLENSKNLFNDFNSIFEKYKQLSAESLKLSKIEKLEKELKMLKNN